MSMCDMQIVIDGGELVRACALHGGIFVCADKADIDADTIRGWCSGRSSPVIEEWLRLMEVLGSDVPKVIHIGGI